MARVEFHVCTLLGVLLSFFLGTNNITPNIVLRTARYVNILVSLLPVVLLAPLLLATLTVGLELGLKLANAVVEEVVLVQELMESPAPSRPIWSILLGARQNLLCSNSACSTLFRWLQLQTESNTMSRHMVQLKPQCAYVSYPADHRSAQVS